MPSGISLGGGGWGGGGPSESGTQLSKAGIAKFQAVPIDSFRPLVLCVSTEILK